MLPKSRFSKLIFGHSAGSTKLDRPHCKQFRQGVQNRYRPKGVFGKVVGNSQNASEMRQTCVKNASEMRQKCVKILLGKEEHPKCVRNASKLRPKCVKNARNTFGGEHLLDDTNKRQRLVGGVRVHFWW